MDYSYQPLLNQAAAAAAAGFEAASSCALAAGDMQCGYGELSSCSQMSQAAAYRSYAARSAAAGYPGAGGGGGAVAPGLGAHHQSAATHPHAHAHHAAAAAASHAAACSVMAARGQDVVHRHAASIFPSAINLQGAYIPGTACDGVHTRHCGKC